MAQSTQTAPAFTPQMSPVIPPAQQKPQQPVLELEDIHLPDSPDFWPPAPGWWIAAALLIGLTALLVIKYLRYKNQRKQQQSLLNALSTFEQELAKGKGSEAIAKMNILLRRLALTHYSRQQVASLTGNSWLKFLDKTGATKDFTTGAGQLLEAGSYSASLPKGFDSKGLIKAIKNWIKKNSTQAYQIKNNKGDHSWK